ncbi:MAG: hypothetical protein NTY70_02595, partial [Burkholderiales bacterium]|nr:hypothetical protein [Burkholderiales bacterium]
MEQRTDSASDALLPQKEISQMNKNALYAIAVMMGMMGMTNTTNTTSMAQSATKSASAAQVSGATHGGTAWSAQGKTVRIYTTARDDGQRLSLTGTVNFVPGSQPLEGDVSVFVDPSHRFQTLLGIGGAITDASAAVFAKLTADQQQALLTAYYDR